jgi:hypothetical protein
MDGGVGLLGEIDIIIEIIISMLIINGYYLTIRLITVKRDHMAQKRNKIVIVGCISLLLISVFLGNLYIQYSSRGGLEETRPIRDIDEEERHSRPYKYVEPLSDSNISNVFDIFMPIFFNNNNITVFFPEGDNYAYALSYGPSDPGGSAIISHINGSEIDRVVWLPLPQGATAGGSFSKLMGFEGGEYLSLNFTGSGIVLFLSVSTSKTFCGDSDYSGTLGMGKMAFYLPLDLTRNLPWNKRIVAETSPENGGNFHVKYYCDHFHFLGEEKGTGPQKTEIPAGSSNFIFAIVESEVNVTFHFTYSSPIQGIPNYTGLCLLSMFFLSLFLFLILIVYGVRLLKKGSLDKFE